MDKNQPKNEYLRRFRAEAASLLGEAPASNSPATSGPTTAPAAAPAKTLEGKPTLPVTTAPHP
jgi:hypothetical protein